MIAWTPSPPYRRDSFDVRVSNAPYSTTSPASQIIVWNIVPHGGNCGKWRVDNVGRNNALALPPQYTNHGPLTCGPFICQPHSTTWRHSGVHVDLRGPCHVFVPPSPRVGSRLRPFWYRYRIPVLVAVTVSSTVKVLNGTRYLRYPIPTSRCRYRLLGVGIGFRYRHMIPTSANG